MHIFFTRAIQDLKLIINKHVTDNWQTAQNVTDVNWQIAKF